MTWRDPRENEWLRRTNRQAARAAMRDDYLTQLEGCHHEAVVHDGCPRRGICFGCDKVVIRDAIDGPWREALQ